MTTAVVAPKRRSASRILAAIGLGLVAAALLVPSGIVLFLLSGQTTGTDGIVEGIRKWGSFFGNELLTQLPYIAFLAGLMFVGIIVLIFLRPRRVRVPLIVAATAPMAVADTAPTDKAAVETPQNGQNTVNSTVAEPSETGTVPYPAAASFGHEKRVSKPIRVYHTRIMGTAFTEGSNAQSLLFKCTVGEILSLHTKTTESGAPIVAFHTITGAALGLMDAALARTIREAYPGHRIGAVLERIEGGVNRPYVAHVAVTVYHTYTIPAPATMSTAKTRVGAFGR